MAEIIQPAPQLSRLVPEASMQTEVQTRVLEEVVSVHAGRIREDPALRSLTEVVRSEPELWNQVVPFIGRRTDFRADYQLDSRVFTPLLSGISYSSPELMDTALQLSARLKSEHIRTSLEGSAEAGIEPYVPVLVVGSGPQSQIFNAQLQQRLPDVQTPAITVDRNNHMGVRFGQATK